MTPACTACGKQYRDHKGLVATCEELQKMKKDSVFDYAKLLEENKALRDKCEHLQQQVDFYLKRTE